MKSALTSLSFAVALLVSAHSQAGNESEKTFKLSTKGGLSVASTDEAYAFKLGGRMQLDYNSYDGVMNASNDGGTGSELFFRRARIVASGKIASDWAFKAEFNVGGNVGADQGGDVTDFYIQYKGWGNKAHLTLGHQLEPFGLENLTSSKNISTIERTAASNAFSSGRALGINLRGYGDNWTYSAGLYQVGSDDSDAIEFSYTGRATYLLETGDDQFIHFGAGVRLSDEGIDNDDINTRPGIRAVSSGNRISSANINSDGVMSYNLETAAIFGPAHVSAEYFNASYDGDNGDADSNFDGVYLLAGWFLTGEQRPYSKKSGSFDKVKPNEKSGAWELVGSVSTVNLQDNNQGNEATVFTLGVNWYANSAIRAGLNIVQTDYDVAINNEDSGAGVAGRLQLVF